MNAGCPIAIGLPMPGPTGDDRFTQPLVRTNDGMKEVSWEQALEEVVGILKEAETLHQA